MAAAAWKGFISFGLISIPVRLYAAARRSRFALHQLHRKCHTRLRQPLFCPTCNRPVDKSEVVKGFEYEEGKYALIEPEEIKKIEPQSARSMDVLAFVKRSEIDPLFFESSYFLVAEEQGRKAYQLLLKALEDTQRVAIAKVTMHQREYTAFIRPYDRGLALHTMYYANEVREAPGYGRTDGIKLNPKEVKLAEQLVKNLSEEFNIRKYHDEFQERLHALIEAKRKGRETAAEAPAPRRAPVIDMMTALKKSLEKAGGAQKQHVRARESSHKPAARRAS
ncbi:MAG TPA: Ku protein [Candidatus Acidoferrales bacterium]|nr:Ku protein [Candidatus Acidoferrales bacterium]